MWYIDSFEKIRIKDKETHRDNQKEMESVNSVLLVYRYQSSLLLNIILYDRVNKRHTAQRSDISLRIQ